MVKQLFKFSALSVAALAFFSCKEQPVGIDKGTVEFRDTSYMAPVEAAQTKNFYVEEFSGVRCTNCPAGALKLEDLGAANPDRLKVVTIHAGSLTAPNYSEGSKQDLRTAQGLQIMNLIYGGEPAKPSASFDRMAVGTGSTPLIGNLNQWDAMLSTVKTQNASTPVNVYVSSVANGADAYNFKVKMAFNADVNGPVFLSLFLVEDSIVDNQIAPLIEDYTFRHVYRESITPITGSAILDSLTTKPAGLVFETTYNFILDLSENSEFRHSTWNLNNVHVYAIVHSATSGADKRIYQVVDCHLK